MEKCRLCLNKSGDTSLFSIFFSEHGNLSQKIEEYVSIKVHKYDKFPLYICLNCLNQINQWENFLKLCKKTNEELVQGYNHDFVLDEVEKQIIEDEINQKDEISDDEDEEEKSDESELALEHIFDENFFEEGTEFFCFQNEGVQFARNNIYTCDICSLDFTDCMEYLDHQNSHDGQAVFKCSKCEEVFSTRKELVAHDNNHPSPCYQCGKMILKRSMKLHLIIHTDKYKCKECPGRFNSQAGLNQHIITVHTDIKDHICETCGKRFSSQSAMRVHMKSHSDQRMYPCKQCTYAGRTASALYIHMATHANDLCVCEVCSKTFKSTRNLNDHLRRAHCKDKKHECTYCAKRFVDKYSLQVHMRCHTGIRPYKCTKCDKSFIRSDGLKEHMLTHGQRILYDCLECGKQFTSKRGVTRHACTAII